MAGFGIIVIMIPVHPQKGQSPVTCSKLAQMGTGAYSYDAFGSACWSVYGASIPINPIISSIKQGAMITNINFNAWSPPAIVTEEISNNTNWDTTTEYNA